MDLVVTLDQLREVRQFVIDGGQCIAGQRQIIEWLSAKPTTHSMPSCSLNTLKRCRMSTWLIGTGWSIRSCVSFDPNRGMNSYGGACQRIRAAKKICVRNKREMLRRRATSRNGLSHERMAAGTAIGPHPRTGVAPRARSCRARFFIPFTVLVLLVSPLSHTQRFHWREWVCTGYASQLVAARTSSPRARPRGPTCPSPVITYPLVPEAVAWRNCCAIYGFPGLGVCQPRLGFAEFCVCPSKRGNFHQLVPRKAKRRSTRTSFRSSPTINVTTLLTI